MDHLNRLKRQIQIYTFLMFAITSGVMVVGWWIGHYVFQAHGILLHAILLVLSLLLAVLFANIITNFTIEPITYIWQAVLHVTPQHIGTAAPNLDKIRLGRELITSLIMQVYQIASTSTESTPKSNLPDISQTLAKNLPVPIFVMNNKQEVIFANQAALTYIQAKSVDILHKHIDSVLSLAFSSDRTFNAWLADCRANKVTDSTSWERVRLQSAEQKTLKQFDVAAYYNKENTAEVETILALFDHTETYNQDDLGLSFVALAVHELRTPLTMLRGYIEVFEDELGDQLNAELKDFMFKMNASAQQLATFVNNILNVARVEENQLVLQLEEENWTTILKGAIADMRLRVQVHGKIVEWEIAPNLPSAAVDRVSIYEVIGNLIDNAIKYSPNSKKIVIKSYLNQEGMIETTVQDYGVGIPSNVVQHLFEKFQRNHRNRAQIGGTGLGLYLSKAIVTAHGGNIWVQSKEGEGSLFGFTLQPYSMLAEELKNSDNKGIVRGAHGWIKNHSLYRR